VHVGTQPLLTPLPAEPQTVLYALGYGVAAWAWTLGLLGLSLRFLSGFSPARRYLADASYWMYLAHLPLVMALQVATARVDSPWWIEYPLALGIAFALLLASYHWLVRDGALGRLLSGRGRSPRAAAGPALAGQL
jgi:peptidoglycan/LPS O-acetylase OafA/YrhL